MFAGARSGNLANGKFISLINNVFVLSARSSLLNTHLAMNLADLLNVSEYSVCVSSMGRFTSMCYTGIRHALLSTYSSAFPFGASTHV